MSSSVKYAELLLRLVQDEGTNYTVESRFSRPGTDAYTEPDAGQAAFDLKALAAIDDIAAYGATLSRALFADPTVLASYQSAVAVAADSQVPLRLRLSIDIDDEALHALRWETLADPLSGTLLATNERILFSRYLRSGDMRPVQWRPRAALRALVLVANPADLAAWGPEGRPLEPLNVDAELAVATAGLGDMPTTRLVGKGQATLENLTAYLRQGWDVVYIVAHGAFVKGRAMLYLEDDEGNTDVVSGVQLASAIARPLTVPRLVVLASCQSAGSGAGGAMAAVGPMLAREGVPAVLAMQGKISIETAAPFMSRFFEELGTDGQIDRAVAVARGEAQRHDRSDAWMPVLFTRLNSGCIWTVPAASAGPWELWDSLLDMIDEGRCVPILGAGVTEFLLGSQQEIAQRWADTYRFPMAAHVRRDLPQVAQYLGVTQRDQQFPRRQLQKYLTLEMRKRYPNELANLSDDQPLDALIQQVGRERRAADPAEPFRVLAGLPLKMYITTTPDNLLTDALTERGRTPAVDLFHWGNDDEVEWPRSVFKERPDYKPVPAEPLVYHLFGRLAERDSVVLTEDDYFRYLVAISQGDQPVPLCVSRAWNDDTLLFLGFRVDDWHFRVLFQSIMKQQGSLRRKQRPHVAVQLDIDESGSSDPERARAYLERYFGIEHINIYWGSSEKFIRELSDLWVRRHPAAAADGRVLATTRRP